MGRDNARSIKLSTGQYPLCHRATLIYCLAISAQTTHAIFAQNLDPVPPSAMDKPLVTDRPDFTESTEVIPTAHTQFEIGYTFTYDREDGQRLRNHTFPEVLVRVGIASDFELRIGWEGYSISDELFDEPNRSGRLESRENTVQGSNDLSLGFKHKLLEQEGLLPHFGIISAISVPSGSPSLSSGDVDPSLVLLWAYDVNDTLAIAGNVGFAGITEGKERFLQTSTSLSLAMSLTDRIGFYIEYFGLYPSSMDTDDAHNINGGFTYLINNDFQLDIRLGAGLNDQADDIVAGIGFSLRI